MDFFTAIGAISSGIAIYDKANSLSNQVKKIVKWLKKGNTKIVIMGAGGTGKTTLAHFLTNNPAYKELNYSQTHTDEKINIGGNTIGSYWIAPGQAESRERYFPEMFREIANGKVCGIIHVVSYGFHSIDAQLSLQGMLHYREGMPDVEYLAALQTHNRATELSILQELKHRIKDSPQKIWLITLVLKQDLWWAEKEKVQEFYTKGAYSTEIAEIAQQKGKQHFEHHYVSASVISHNFSIAGKIFQPITQGYDEALRIANLNGFITQLKAFLH